ncbi:MAG: cytochrome c biogenesis protein [Flavobacteriales bacterium]
MKVWLKVICILLLVYTAIAGMVHPLIPGGLDVRTETLHPGLNSFTFIGYNTSFLEQRSELQLFVAVDSTFFCATITEVTDNTHASATVELPDTLPSVSFAFYANTPHDGTVYVGKAVSHRGFATDPVARPAGCNVNVVSDEHAAFGFPFQIILFETIRNIMWHVPMWFTMFVLMLFSMALSIKTLRAMGQETTDVHQYKKVLSADRRARIYASSGMLFCLLGLVTGSIWARFTWGAWWTMDPQLNGAMVVFLVYAAYFILRSSIEDEEKRARLAAIFNIFAAVLMVILLMIMPRFAEGLHPGKSGNPAFSQYDLDSSLRTVFYPAVLGWILLGYWLYSIHYRIAQLEETDEHDA